MGLSLLVGESSGSARGVRIAASGPPKAIARKTPGRFLDNSEPRAFLASLGSEGRQEMPV